MNTNANKNNLSVPRVVIVGAGFGGLRTARTLAGKRLNVTLVDQHNYHLFQPLLYQVATAMLTADAIAYPVRATLHNSRNLNFHLGEVDSIDLDAKKLVTSNGNLSYDYLVLAPGGETNYFGLESVAQHGFALKDLSNAHSIRNHLLLQFERAVVEPDPEKRRAMLTFVVVGGGPTGVECAGAIAELVRIVLDKDYPTLDISEVEILLLEALDRLLISMPEDLGQITAEVLQRKDVDVQFGCVVNSYDGEKVSLKDGRTILTHTLIWAAGVRAARLLDSLPLEQDRLGRIKVNHMLQTPDRPEVFVIGDAAHFVDEDGNLLPMLAPVAIQQAKAVAHNIVALAHNKPLKEFRYRDPGVLATIGRNQAVAHLGRWKFHGLLAWVLWVGVHIFQLIGFRNRLAVLLDWAWSYIFYERAVRLIVPDKTTTSA